VAPAGAAAADVADAEFFAEVVDCMFHCWVGGFGLGCGEEGGGEVGG